MISFATGPVLAYGQPDDDFTPTDYGHVIRGRIAPQCLRCGRPLLQTLGGVWCEPRQLQLPFDPARQEEATWRT